ncbi:hypothetical protein ACH5RR_017824 [Cinchona calisaya]|uniref:non-specific serine/threonine protein kinase n=1 Tax=Cinchona calisaya TaxID=153742 RepID=A0ABD2ZNC0_9GENT
MEMIFIFARLYYILLLIFFHVGAPDILTPSEAMTDDLALVSAGDKFEFGFFSPENSKNSYLGIWYYRIAPKTVVWVENRNNPHNDSSGILNSVEDGNWILRDHAERILWSTNIQEKSSNQTILQLLDSGNLLLRHGNNGKAGSYLWQSFDHFTDTWKLYTVRAGPWNGARFSGIISLHNIYFNLDLIVNAEEIRYVVPENSPTLTRTVVSYNGEVHCYVWNSSSLEWLLWYTIPIDPCDNYGQCGPNSICTISDASICSCLTGYMPKSPQDWEIGIRSNGCIRKHPLNCTRGEGFLEVKDVKVPDQWVYWMNTSLTLKDCQEQCLKNCSCTVYANSNLSGKGSGCLLWYGDLIYIRRLSYPSNQTIYLRAGAADLGSKKRKQVISVVVACSFAMAMLVLTLCTVLLKRSKRQVIKAQLNSEGMEDLELPTFEMISIAEATNNFSELNKIGEGGFGPVYRGQMPTGQERAVKRLSINSHQGLIEFKNEVILISKLQHRNLVKLLGCFIQGEERMLIYEYMPCKSLDNFIHG